MSDSAVKIDLSPDQRAWLEAKVTAGLYPTVEAAAAAAIDDCFQGEHDDLGWARPLVDAARASIERGDGLSDDEFSEFVAAERVKLG